jgi:hypothetical protein
VVCLVRQLKRKDAPGHSLTPPQPEKIRRRRRKYNSAVRRQIFGGVGAVGFSAAAEFGGAGV